MEKIIEVLEMLDLRTIFGVFFSSRFLQGMRRSQQMGLGRLAIGKKP